MKPANETILNNDEDNFDSDDSDEENDHALEIEQIIP
jgi:hypothetical protein